MTAQPEYDEHSARVDLAAAHRLAVLDNLHEACWNHLSLTVPERPNRIFITATMQHWSTVRASDLAELGPDVEGEALDAEDQHRWIGYRIHYPLHQARPDARCVLHLHPPYATALAMVHDGRVEMAEQNALHFDGKIGYNDEYDAGRPVGLDQGAAMAEALGAENIALILKNHGIVVVGPTVGIAYTRAYLLERSCMKQWIAKGYGQPLAIVPEGRRETAGTRFMESNFVALKRLLESTQPDYRL